MRGGSDDVYCGVLFGSFGGEVDCGVQWDITGAQDSEGGLDIGVGGCWYSCFDGDLGGYFGELEGPWMVAIVERVED